MIRSVMGLVLAGLAGGICSCGRIESLLNKPRGSTAVPKVPSHLRAGGGGPSGEPITRVTLDKPQDVTATNVDRLRKREEELVWTDPDNPEQELKGMAEVIAKGARRGPWRASFLEGKKAAMREGKPLVVWFTDTKRSPLCRALSAEVFSKAAFGSWATEEVVRVRLDFNVRGEASGPDSSAMDDRIRKLDYLESLKKRYKVLGLPTVLVMAANGTVTGRYRGYQRTYGNYYVTRLQHDAAAAKKHHEDWIQKMGRRGYRQWNDAKSRTVFAKLLRYKDGELILVEPDGRRLKAMEGNLSGADQDWVRREKQKRGL